MKILHVSDVYVRHGGGAPNVIQALAKEQKKAGHEVLVLTFQQSTDWPLEEELDGVSVRRTSIKSNSLPFYFSGFKNMQQLAQEVLSDFRPDVVNLHMPFSGWAVASQLSLDTPVVYTFHGSWAEEYEVEAKGFKRWTGVYLLEKILMRKFEKKVLGRASKILTLSKFMQSRAKKYRVNPTHGWRVVPGGVDLDRFSNQDPEFMKEFRKKHNIPKEAFFVLTIRRLAKRMGLEELIRAVGLTTMDVPNIYLVIGGKGELLETLHKQIKTLNMQDHVRLEGFIPEEDLPDYYAAADLFVLPTQSLEGFGLINLEAMASGTPVIGTLAGAIPEVIEPFKKEFVLDGFDHQDIAAGIINYYKKYYFSKQQEISQGARKYAEGFSWGRMADSYQKVYDELV